MLSADYCRDGRLHNQLIHAIDIAIHPKHKMPLCPLHAKFSFLYNSSSDFHERIALAYLLRAFYHYMHSLIVHTSLYPILLPLLYSFLNTICSVLLWYCIITYHLVLGQHSKYFPKLIRFFSSSFFSPSFSSSPFSLFCHLVALS